jgi:hypothetical protein
MPKSAMPEHLNDPEEIDAAFPDDDQYGTNWFGRLYRWYNKKTKTWFAFSYRCTEWWAKWRVYPRVLFAIGGKGPWRWEPTYTRKPDIYDYNKNPTTGGQPAFYYLSRIQYYKRWHLAIQWPFIVTFHVYFRASDVPVCGTPSPITDGKLLFFFWNHFDADLVYWMITSIFLGTTWK